MKIYDVIVDYNITVVDEEEVPLDKKGSMKTVFIVFYIVVIYHSYKKIDEIPSIDIDRELLKTIYVCGGRIMHLRCNNFCL